MKRDYFQEERVLRVTYRIRSVAQSGTRINTHSAIRCRTTNRAKNASVTKTGTGARITAPQRTAFSDTYSCNTCDHALTYGAIETRK